jgi:uncharacterized delta-60 repeat protein
MLWEFNKELFVMKNCLKACFSLFGVLVFSLSVFAQLDTSFGSGGTVASSVPVEMYPTKLVQTSSGKLLIASDFLDGSFTPSNLRQFNANGTIDLAFGSSGVLQLNNPTVPGKLHVAKEIATQPDGKTVIAGSTRVGFGVINSFITRLNSNGTVDTGFASNGFHYPIMSQNGGDSISFIKIESDGKILVGGLGGFGVNFFIRYIPNGSLDTSFHGQGYFFATSLGYAPPFKQQADGKFLVDDGTTISRMNQDGTTVDNTFATIARPLLHVTFVTNTDKIVIASAILDEEESSSQIILVERFNSNGTVDSTFGNNGKARVRMAGFFTNQQSSLVVKANGDIFVATETLINRANRSSILGRKFGVAKLDTNGNLIGRFLFTNNNAVETSPLRNDGVISVLNNGKIVVAYASELTSTTSNLTVSQLIDVPAKTYNVRPMPFASPVGYLIKVFRPSNGIWYDQYGYLNFLGTSGDVPLGDSFNLTTVFRPSDGTWRFESGAVTQWGQLGDIPTPGDFDGDSRADFTAFRPSNGFWYINNERYVNSGAEVKNRIGGQNVSIQWGMIGDKPVYGDFDGDAKDDIAVFRPSNGVWYIRNSSNGQFTFMQFGLVGDIPVQEDYDGDGKFDIAVFRPSNGTWYRLNSSSGSFVAFQWGLPGDVPVPADYDRDGKVDVGVFRSGTWYLYLSATNSFYSSVWGLPTDIPVQFRN